MTFRARKNASMECWREQREDEKICEWRQATYLQFIILPNRKSPRRNVAFSIFSSSYILHTRLNSISSFFFSFQSCCFYSPLSSSTLPIFLSKRHVWFSSWWLVCSDAHRKFFVNLFLSSSPCGILVRLLGTNRFDRQKYIMQRTASEFYRSTCTSNAPRNASRMILVPDAPTPNLNTDSPSRVLAPNKTRRFFLLSSLIPAPRRYISRKEIKKKVCRDAVWYTIESQTPLHTRFDRSSRTLFFRTNQLIQSQENLCDRKMQLKKKHTYGDLCNIYHFVGKCATIAKVFILISSWLIVAY